MELTHAVREWARRPADQRFWTVRDLHDHCREARSGSVIQTVRSDSLRVVPQDGGLRLAVEDYAAGFTPWSFSQLCRRVRAPADYLGTLPAELAADCLMASMRGATEPGREFRVLLRVNGGATVRALTSVRYVRIWNEEVTRRLLTLGDRGWRVPPAKDPGIPGVPTRPATEEDCRVSTTVRPGDPIAPSGLYASDRDMFAFFVHGDCEVADGLRRGFFIANSEVGDRALRVTWFLHNFVCGNHIVWGARDVREIRIRHVGHADDRFAEEFLVSLRQYADAPVSGELQVIRRARARLIGRTKDEVLDAVFGRRTLGLGRRLTSAAYDAAEEHEDWYGDPRSVWGLANGLSEVSQARPYAGDRMAVDAAAGRLLEMEF